MAAVERQEKLGIKECFSLARFSGPNMPVNSSSGNLDQSVGDALRAVFPRSENYLVPACAFLERMKKGELLVRRFLPAEVPKVEQLGSTLSPSLSTDGSPEEQFDFWKRCVERAQQALEALNNLESLVTRDRQIKCVGLPRTDSGSNKKGRYLLCEKPPFGTDWSSNFRLVLDTRSGAVFIGEFDSNGLFYGRGHLFVGGCLVGLPERRKADNGPGYLEALVLRPQELKFVLAEREINWLANRTGMYGKIRGSFGVDGMSQSVSITLCDYLGTPLCHITAPGTFNYDSGFALTEKGTIWTEVGGKTEDYHPPTPDFKQT